MPISLDQGNGADQGQTELLWIAVDPNGLKQIRYVTNATLTSGGTPRRDDQ